MEVGVEGGNMRIDRMTVTSSYLSAHIISLLLNLLQPT